MFNEGQYHVPNSQYNNELFHAHHRRGHQPQTSAPDPTMGRTNIPMHLPPGSLTHNAYPPDSSAVTLTPLSPPHVSHHNQEGLVSGLEVPYAHHAHSHHYGRTYNHPQAIPIPADAMLTTGKGYVPFHHPQNGSVPQAFFGTSRLFSEGDSFPFKFGGPNVGPLAANPNPFHFHQAQGNGLDSPRPHLPPHGSNPERTRHMHYVPNHHGGRGRREQQQTHDDASPMMGVVVQR